jgi:sec-independent protein translocase protein TatA
MPEIGTGEILVILVLALLLFGGSLPDVARNLGKSVGDLKRSFTDSTRPLREAKDEVEREVAEIGEEKNGPGPV